MLIVYERLQVESSTSKSELPVHIVKVSGLQCPFNVSQVRKNKKNKIKNKIIQCSNENIKCT